MDFIFQGFQSWLPLWAFILIFISTVLLSWWSYRSITGIRKGYRYVLIALRSATFFVLLVLLLNPFLKKERAYFKDPHILVMLDNSASTAIEKRTYKGTESYRQVLDELNFQDSSDISYNFFSIGNEVNPTNPKQLTFDADQTNLSQSVEVVRGNESDASAAILISDGVFTKGQNPVYEIKDMEVPLFTIGLGDTTFQKDVLVSSVTTNSSGYLNSTQPLTTTISTKGFKGQSFDVELRKANEVIATKRVTPQLSEASQEISFELPLEQEGLQQFVIRIPALADEWTQENNVQRFSVDVKDARQQILSLAFEVHPDVKLIRSLLLEDKNTTLTKRTWLRGDQFIEGDLAVSPDSIDLVIIHGYPRLGLPGGLQKKIKDLADNVPFIIAGTPMFSPQRFEQQVASLPVSVTGSWSYASVSLNPESASTAHPIMEFPAVTYDRLPSIKAPIENLDNAPGATKLFSSKYQGRDTQKPVLIIQELGNRRISLVTAFGWYRMEQNINPEIRKFVQQLWLNIVSWTATDPDNQLLEVRPAQTSFSGSERVVLNGYLKNERGEIETDANIGVSISSDSMDARFYSMENKGGGQYQLDLGSMPEGIYAFEATARKGDRTIDTQQGEFAVARSNAEYLDINRNEQLLRQLAQRSGGEYMPFDSVNGFWSRLNERGLLDRQQEIRTTFFYPYQQVLWFVIVLVLLSAEWIFRKYLSLP